MPKRGKIECDNQNCNFTIEAELPSFKFIGSFYYYLITTGGDIPEETALQIIDHHNDTRVLHESGAVVITGHDDSSVSLADGNTWKIEATGYALNYHEITK